MAMNPVYKEQKEAVSLNSWVLRTMPACQSVYPLLPHCTCISLPFPGRGNELWEGVNVLCGNVVKNKNRVSHKNSKK